MSALKQKNEKKADELRYRAYITDALMIIAENTTHFVGAKEMFDYGKSLNSRWVDLVKPQKKKPEEPKIDNRSAAEIAQDIWKRMRKK